jgi:hypothetical protein
VFALRRHDWLRGVSIESESVTLLRAVWPNKIGPPLEGGRPEWKRVVCLAGYFAGGSVYAQPTASPRHALGSTPKQRNFGGGTLPISTWAPARSQADVAELLTGDHLSTSAAG